MVSWSSCHFEQAVINVQTVADPDSLSCIIYAIENYLKDVAVFYMFCKDAHRGLPSFFLS